MKAQFAAYLDSIPLGEEMAVAVVIWCWERVAVGIADPLEQLEHICVDVCSFSGEVLELQISPNGLSICSHGGGPSLTGPSCGHNLDRDRCLESFDQP